MSYLVYNTLYRIFKKSSQYWKRNKKKNQNLALYHLDLKILLSLLLSYKIWISFCWWLWIIILQLEQWTLWQSDLHGIDSFDWVTCVGWILQIQTQDQTTARIPTWQVAIHHAQLLFQYYIWSWTQQTNENYSANNWISQGSQSKVIHSDSDS